MTDRRNRPTYSTGPGGALPAGYQACRKCGAWPCRCEPQKSTPTQQQQPRVRRETKGRAGKTVTTASPLLLSRDDAQALLADLKKLCGAGGALKSDKGPDGAFFMLEVQGDHADKLLTELLARGYKAKLAGG